MLGVMESVILIVVVVFCLPVAGFAEPPDETGKTLAVEGQVYDHLGSGSAGVAVTLWPEGAAGEDQPLAEAATNGLGDFKIFTENPVAGRYVVRFTKKAYEDTTRDIEIVRGELPPFVDLVLPGALELTGQVLADDRKPIAGARVRLNSAGRSWDAFTGEDGKFTVSQVLPGPGTIVVDLEGFGRSVSEIATVEGAGELALTLSPERDCRVVVKDWRGNVIEGASVTCADPETRERWFAESDASGDARLRGLPRSLVELRVGVRHNDYVSDDGAPHEWLLPTDEAECVYSVNLLSAGSVAGVITDKESGDPLRGVRVAVGTSLAPSVARAWTDFEGRYTVTGVPPGETRVTTYLRGHAPELVEIVVQPSEVVTVDIVMPESLSASGTVVDHDGKPVSGAYVFASHWRGGQTLGIQAMTGDDGRFEFDTIPTDEFSVTIQGRAGETLEDQTVTPGCSDHRFELPAAPERKSRTRLADGADFPELELTTLDGVKIKTTDLKGKTFLIDFWASWCGPCVVELPELVKVHEAFGSRDDFVMINVSLDDDGSLKSVRRLIAKHKMKWPQIHGSKNGARGAGDACGVVGLPTKFLVGPDGKILSTTIRGPAIETQISRFLKSK